MRILEFSQPIKLMPLSPNIFYIRIALIRPEPRDSYKIIEKEAETFLNNSY